MEPICADETAQPPTLACLAALRRGLAEQGPKLPLPKAVLDVSDHRAGATRLRLYKPVGGVSGEALGLPVLVFLHGGGWILGDLDTHDACCRWLSVSAECAVLAVDYRLAPDSPFPLGLQDATVAWQWARQQTAALECDPRRIAIGGESAGANLAAALTLLLRDKEEAQPLFQLLVHPPTDLRLQQPSIRSVALPGLDPTFLAECVRAYAGGASVMNPLLSPLLAADLSGLAPAVVVTVEQDPLRDDGEHYALALARAGVEVSLQRLPDLPHGFMFLPATLPAVANAYRLIGERVARYFRSA